jgi:leucyl aminopeptidase
MMLLALDYDETYTRDPEFWDMMIELAKNRGHSIICATMRYEREGADVEAALASKVEKIIYTGRKAKHGAVYAAGYMPSVWIDDSPHWIHVDAAA